MCGEERYITIYKGDDSTAFGVRKIRIVLDSSIPMEGATACFKFYSFCRSFTAEEVADNNMVVEFSRDETATLPPGRAYASFKLFDSEDRVMTASSRIPMLVKLGGAPAVFDNRGIVVDSEVAVIRVAVDIDYALLTNLPKVNGVVITGDRLGRDYGLNRIPDYSNRMTYSVGDQCVYGKTLYSCKTAIAVPEEWNPEHWEMFIVKVTDVDAVHYTTDVGRTDAEKEAARQNLGAASVQSVSDLARSLRQDICKRVKVESLKAAVTDPADVKLALSSIKDYIVGLYEAIQAL